MASWFQPPISGDPVIAACNDVNGTTPQRSVYCNRVLSQDDLFRTQLQHVTVAVAAGCIGCTLLVWFGSWVRFALQKKQTFGDSTFMKSSSPQVRKRSSQLSGADDVKRTLFANVQSFHEIPADSRYVEVDGQSTKKGHATIVCMPSFTESESDYPPILTRRSPGQLIFASVKAPSITQTTMPVWINFLEHLTHHDAIISAVVLQVCDLSQNGTLEQNAIVKGLLCGLHDRNIPVLLRCRHDDLAVLALVDIGLIDGLIIDNACILSNGEHRDYFHSQPLRDVISKCSHERIERPGFFVGFHDIWDQRPSAAVVCRAEKVARHFGAVWVHYRQTASDTPRLNPSPRSISGFEYLRRPEISQLQTAWLRQKRPVLVNTILGGEEEQVAQLDLSALESVVPDIHALLASSYVPSAFQTFSRPERAVPTPPFVTFSPRQGEFWELTAEDDFVSPFGCVPLMSSATESHYNAILGTQSHLRDLGMLHKLDETEINKVVEHLRLLQATTQYPHLVKDLEERLAQQLVVVYKGLATGFMVPDTAAEFWGVSLNRQDRLDGAVDIFISRNSPGETSTILHTWLAHHGVSRIHRYEEEILLVSAVSSSNQSALPPSIQLTIDRATPSESLQMLQRLHLCQVSHHFAYAIQQYCDAVLVDGVSHASWNDAVCRGFLDQSITMEDVLQRRLNHWTDRGALRLPSIANLLQLFTKVQRMTEEALFYGDGETINKFVNVLLQAYDPDDTRHELDFIDVNADLVALMFLCALRKAALDAVYLEATDHCPLFSQPDQAAVFSELWVLGSQCELYFGIPPRTLGKIIYDRHVAHLERSPPPANFSPRKDALMTVYAKPDPISAEGSTAPKSKPLRKRLLGLVADFGALSIFCLPAIIDILLLSFVGRGLFMTAYMGDHYLSAACFGLLISLLLSAGVTGWVGSVGNYYLFNYAYNSMVFFHVQRLSGGFVLSFVVGVVGTCIFWIKLSVSAAFAFLAYIMLISTYLNLLGIMATMHQKDSPLTSGRTVLWRTTPVLLLSPLISSLVTGYDVEIYLAVGYGFILLLLFQYRMLCREWAGWMDNIPKFTEPDILAWYSSRLQKQRPNDYDSSRASVASHDQDSPDVVRRSALEKFRACVEAHGWDLLSFRNTKDQDSLVTRVAKGLPYVEWLLRMEGEGKEDTEVFSVPWFAQLTEALKKRQQMVQGLKEHSIFMLFRYSSLDIGQNVGLFLICLMDRWVSIIMAAHSPPVNVFSDFTSRYAVCFAIVYFCCSVMVLDVTLQGYWKISYDLPDGKLSSCEELRNIQKGWERQRRMKYWQALARLGCRILFIFGCSTMLVWLLVDNTLMIELYYLYSLGYTGVIIFQFNRCFTANAQHHIVSILLSAAIGFVTGCILHVVRSPPLFFTDVIALDVSAVTAAILTSVWVFRGPQPGKGESSDAKSEAASDESALGPLDCQSSTGQTELTLNSSQEVSESLDFNKEWDTLPHAVRKFIYRRVLGQDCTATQDVLTWMSSRKLDMNTIDSILGLRLHLQRQISQQLSSLDRHPSLRASATSGVRSTVAAATTKRGRSWRSTWKTLKQLPLNVTKWVAIISGGGSNVERELWHSLRHYPRTRRVALSLVMPIWRLCWILRNAWIYLILIHHHKSLAHMSRLAKRGVSRTIHKDRVTVDLLRKNVTGFASKDEYGLMVLEAYEGRLKTPPADGTPAVTSFYDQNYRLLGRNERKGKGQVVSTYSHSSNGKSISRIPTCKRVTDGTVQRTCFFDERGRITHGNCSFDGIKYRFRYFYKSTPKGSHEVLGAEFQLAKNPSAGSLTVLWGDQYRGDMSVGTRLDWIPSDRVCKVARTAGQRSYITAFDYRHKRDPVITTVLAENGTRNAVFQPPRLFKHEDLLLQRPTEVLFEHDDLLIHHQPAQIKSMTRFAGKSPSWINYLNPSTWLHWRKKSANRQVSTRWLRSELWGHWRKSGALDAITACWLDELIVREEPILKSYWSARNSGNLWKAKEGLDNHIEQIAGVIEIEKEVAEVCMLPIKPSDLYSMGLGKDANQVTTRPQDCFQDTEDRISVIFNDIGCWPENPGGVSNCRRDLVDGHSTIRNHVLAESANDYGIPRFQVEKSVQSIKVLPLWGLDGRVASHGLIDNLLEYEVERKILDTDIQKDVVGTFVPLLKLFVKGARSRHISKAGMLRYSNVILDMFYYFESKDYNKTWNSKEVAYAWAEAWLTRYDDPHIAEMSECFELQKPTMSDFRDSLAIFSSYLFIFSVQTPEDCPKVFQSTHHGISSLFGMFLKYRRGTTFGIWDHAILWRECCLNISPAQSTLPLPVQSMVLAGMGLAMKLAYLHADVVLPCTPLFNPLWESDLGTDGNRIGHLKEFTRKIDPITNGVSDMDAFKPVDEVRTTKPTVVMLSNVQFIKDIRTAIRAADVIVNQYGFKDYQLLVYGAKDREPDYAIDMSKLIESCNLGEHVILKGFGKPQEILKDAWLFMNSSLSEGLPLAVAEAALAGVPIVATAVGATALVLTDPDDPSVSYGEVVPPNDPTALARAQLGILAMAGPWAKFAGDVDKRGSVLPGLTLPDTMSPRDVQWLSKRMRDKTESRRKLGMLSRGVVLRGFHGKRYLREHEQMYWIQWHMAQMRKEPSLTSSPSAAVQSQIHDEMRKQAAKSGDGGVGRKRSVRWQEFASHLTPYRGKRLSKIRESREYAV